jgi:signal transduction histidine kinase
VSPTPVVAGSHPALPSIRRALQKQSILALLLVLSIAGVGLAVYVRQLLCASFDDSLMAQTRVLSAFVEEELGEKVDIDLSDVKLPDFQAGPTAQYFELWVVPDKLAARSASLGEAGLSRVDLGNGASRFWDLALPDGRAGRAVALQLQVPPLRKRHKPALPPYQLGAPQLVPPPVTEPRPLWAHLVVARERGSLDAVLRQVALALGLLGTVLLALVPFIVTRVARRALRPLDHFADRVAEIDAQSLSGQVAGPFDVPDELRPIAAKLNDLLARLHASFERERRFSADVAHELRTPLAELRAIAEVALQFPGDPEARATAFEDVRDAAIQMERLVNSLRTLAACEGGGQTVATVAVDVGQLVEHTWARFADRAQARSLSVHGGRGPAGLVIQSDPVLLESVIGNLFSNAIDHAPAGGAIEWAVAAATGQVTVSISNTNADLRAEDVPHVFEPFWRKDAARTNGAHSGLGLSLAEAFAGLLAARLTLALESSDRVRAQLSLPA